MSSSSVTTDEKKITTPPKTMIPVQHEAHPFSDGFDAANAALQTLDTCGTVRESEVRALRVLYLELAKRVTDLEAKQPPPPDDE